MNEWWKFYRSDKNFYYYKKKEEEEEMTSLKILLTVHKASY